MEGVNLLPQTQVDKRCPSRKKMETNLNPTQSPILTGWQGIWSWSLRLPSLPRDVSGTQEAGVEGPLALSPPCRALSSFNTPWASDLGDGPAFLGPGNLCSGWQSWCPGSCMPSARARPSQGRGLRASWPPQWAPPREAPSLPGAGSISPCRPHIFLSLLNSTSVASL